MTWAEAMRIRRAIAWDQMGGHKRNLKFWRHVWLTGFAS
jgi:CII-binding regulator of phage lambda lysogenization HflD